MNARRNIQARRRRRKRADNRKRFEHRAALGTYCDNLRCTECNWWRRFNRRLREEIDERRRAMGYRQNPDGSWTNLP